MNHFWYYKLTNNGFITFIGSHAEWTEYFATEKLYLKYPYCRHPKYLQEGVYLYKDVQEKSLRHICNIGQDKFNIQMSLKIQVKIADGIEVFGFSSSVSNDAQTTLFLNQVPSFYLFMKWFRENNRNIFNKMEDNFVDLANLIEPAFYEKSDFLSAGLNSRKQFLEKIGMSYLNLLTSKEMKIVKLVFQGYSAGKIAQQIFLSKRTVEHHIERIKQKLSCDSKFELIQKARELELLGCFSSI